MDFEQFPKIPRLNRECIVTEKIDGTNAQIRIENVLSSNPLIDFPNVCAEVVENGERYLFYAGSRSRWVTPTQDNFGFASFVHKNAKELLVLGIGSHFGEWWGRGIQRGYGMKDRIFSLFNTKRWKDAVLPDNVRTVPELYTGLFETAVIQTVLAGLARNGSTASPGFMDPEGVVVFHTAARVMMKATIKDDEKPKG